MEEGWINGQPIGEIEQGNQHRPGCRQDSYGRRRYDDYCQTRNDHQKECRKQPEGAASIEVLERNGLALLPLFDQQCGNQKATQREENINPEKPSLSQKKESSVN